MAEFEPPKPQALSDAELHRAINLLGNSTESLAQAEALLSKQATIREADSKALAEWIRQMQLDGSKEAQQALAAMVLDVMPSEIVETEPSKADPMDSSSEPLFTSEIAQITPRKQHRKRVAQLTNIRIAIGSWLVVALVNALVSHWLELSASESIGSAVIGLILAAPLIGLLKSHALHPLLRSAAVFGGWGVYLGAGILLSGLSLVVVQGSLSVAQVDLLPSLVDGYPSALLASALLALLLSQFLTRHLHTWSLLISAISIVAYELGRLGGFPRIILEEPDAEKLLWGSLATGLVTSALFIFGQPHQRVSVSGLGWQVPLGILLSCLVALLPTSNLFPVAIIFIASLSIALAGRDLSSNAWGRLAGLAYIVPIILLPFGSYISGPMVAVLTAAVALISLDQALRRSALHIPSLDTSYGFYGSFQVLSWTALIVSAPLGTEVIQGLLLPDVQLSQHELALIFGLVIGSVFGLIRLFVVRGQDREIRNVEFRNMNLDNLLGL